MLLIVGVPGPALARAALPASVQPVPGELELTKLAWTTMRLFGVAINLRSIATEEPATASRR